MPDLVLINPPWYMAAGNLDDLWLPVPNGLASLAAAVRASGHTVAIIDAFAEGYDQRQWVERGGCRVLRIGLSEDAISERLRSSGAWAVGVGNMFTAVFRGAMECAAVARRTLPQARIILGGVHASCAPDDAIAVPEADFVVCGEGEQSLPALLRHLQDARLPMPAGVYWKAGGVIHNSGPPQPVAPLDALPLPAYDLLPMERYHAATRRDLISRGRKTALTMPLVTSRGCPFGCIFCGAHRINGRRWRGRSPAGVVDEIEMLHRRYGIRSFTIEDSNFSFEESRAVAICEEIVRRGLKIHWNTPNGLRADRITPPLIAACKRAGCYEVTLAAEHGDQDFLNRVVKKSLDLEDIFRAGAMIRRAGLAVSCFLMMGFPGETEREVARTAAFGRRLARAGIFPLFFIAAPLPGTSLHRTLVEAGRLPPRPLSPEAYLCAMRFPMRGVSGIRDLTRWRHRAMWQSSLIFLFCHPLAACRLPALRKFFLALLAPHTFRDTWRKLYNQLFRTGGTGRDDDAGDVPSDVMGEPHEGLAFR